MKRRIVLVLSVSVVVLLAISIFLPFSQLPEAKSVNAVAYEEFSVLSDEAKVLRFVNDSPKRQSEIYRGLLESQAKQMELNLSQKKWVKDALDFHDEEFFGYLDKNIPIKNYEEFSKTEIMKSFEQLQKRKNELFPEDQASRFCLDSTITDRSAKSRAIKASMRLVDDPISTEGNCTCLDDSWC